MAPAVLMYQIASLHHLFYLVAEQSTHYIFAIISFIILQQKQSM